LSALKKLLSQTAIYGLSHILGRLVNYLLVPLHTRVFHDPAEYGTITEMYSYVSFFIVVLTYGMETTFFRFSQKFPGERKVYSTALISLLVTSVIFIAAATLLAEPLAASLQYATHPEYVTWFAVILGCDAVAAIPFAMLRQQNRPVRFALLKNINILINVLLNLYFLLLCPYLLQQGLFAPFYDPSIGVGYVFISNMLASVITLPLLSQEIRLVFSGFDFAIWKQMLRYGAPLLIVGLGGMVNETLDRAIMKYLITDKETAMHQLGVYGANYKLSILISLFIQAFRYAAEPFFFSGATDANRKLLYAKVMNYFVLVCLSTFLLVMLFIEQFKNFVGPDYHEGLNIVPILLLANICLGVYFNLSIWFKLADKTSVGAIISAVGALITISLNLWWVPLYGYTGAAWATLFCYFSMMLMGYFTGAKYFPIPYQIRRLALYALLAFLIYFGAGYLHAHVLSDGPLRWVINVLLLLLFAGIGYTAERKNKMLNLPA
jgi:O-antigen/teichoic acid export membrane protein